MSVRQFAGYVAVGTLIVAGIGAALWLLIRLQALVALILIAIVLATGIAPLVERLERHRIPRALAILTVYLVVFIIFLAIAAFITAIVVKQSITFSNNLPGYIGDAQKSLAYYQSHYKWLPDLSRVLQQAPEQLKAVGTRVVSSIPRIFGFLGSLVSLLSILIINFYILMTREELRTSFLSMVPEANRKHARRIFKEMGTRMGGWLRGQVMLALIVGVTTTIALWLMKIPYAGLIGLIAALAELIPMVGPAVAAVPAVLWAIIAGDLWQVIASLAFFGLLSQVDSSYLTPRIMKQSVGLSPLATILALLIGASLLGAVGALLAVPLAAAVQVLFSEVINPAIQRAGANHAREKQG